MNGRYRLPVGSELNRRHFIAALSVATLGAVGLANHTWLHPNLTKLPLPAVAEELRHNHDFRYFNPQAIVIGHLNHLPVTEIYDQLVDVIRSRQLRTVILDDVFLKPGAAS